LILYLDCRYTLRNAEYRLCFERNLDVCEDHYENEKPDSVEHANHEITVDRTPTVFEFSERDGLLPNLETGEEAPTLENMDIENVGELTPDAQKYILYLTSRLSSAQKVCSQQKLATLNDFSKFRRLM